MHQRWSAGFEARIRHWAGIDRFTPRGMIGGRRVIAEGISKPPFYRYNLFEKQVYFSAYHISANSVDDYVDGMKRYGVQYMTGYAMSNYFLARFIQESKIDAPPLKAVITSSEKLTPAMRQVFYDVYRCKTYDSWSGVEACGLVSECEHGSLHISPDIGIIELLDDSGKPVKPGETGEVVCTGLINFDQPLIRYRIGDKMQLGDRPCACGRSMPVIKEIMGRMEDTVVGKDGREIVRFHGIFIDLPNLIEAQLIQEDYDVFTIKAVASNGTLTEKEQAIIRQRMESQLGKIQLSIEQVSAIPRNPNGKFQAVISKVKRPLPNIG
jgi:phenylacetate-CoA ligase